MGVKTVEQRWEDGDDHDPRAVALVKSIVALDLEHGGDYFCFKVGGDGDNGEHLAYLLDIHFEKLDAAPTPPTLAEACEVIEAACRADVTELLDLLDAEAQGWLDSGNRLIGDGIGRATRAIRARLAANKEKT